MTRTSCHFQLRRNKLVHYKSYLVPILPLVELIASPDVLSYYSLFQYYLEKNLEARARELERQAEVEEKAPKVKAKSKMSKVRPAKLLAPWC